MCYNLKFLQQGQRPQHVPEAVCRDNRHDFLKSVPRVPPIHGGYPCMEQAGKGPVVH